jgi:hypothetical protein
MNIEQAYERAHSQITSKGYCTNARQPFLNGVYYGWVLLVKQATWKCPVRTSFIVYKKGERLRIKTEAKKQFIEKFVNGKYIKGYRK